ncbi:hypothetical protein CBR_g22426 [Chara braunii]|uniref:Expansin n=1 Tax=Chara braunii TaxID=69332 RepID=A0A388JV04_CHABU|nr:hypothetical protein CBR_g22426 [Chara braunii]|eukprot:GBG61628.1 hypothetical protein CBR_g22426 [Chara braunii]
MEELFKLMRKVSMSAKGRRSLRGLGDGGASLSSLQSLKLPKVLLVITIWLALLSKAEFSARASLVSSLCNLFAGNPGLWQDGRATYYGSEAFGGDNEHNGACGYGTLSAAFVGHNYAAASPVIFESGRACGGCFEVQCRGNGYPCRAGTARVTVTDLCPPIPPNLRHCAGGKAHLDLGVRVFPIIADPRAGVVDIRFRTVPCGRFNAITFFIRGNVYGWLSLVVMGVPASGRVVGMEVKASGSTNWEALRHDYGAAYMRTGRPLRTPISVRLSIFGKLCRMTAMNCIPTGFKDRQKVSCSYRSG